MEEAITNVEGAVTQEPAAGNEVNTSDVQQTQADVQQSNEATVENSNEEVSESNQENTQDTTQDGEQQKATYEELQAKLNEYQVREEEERMIREKLGMGDIDQQTFNYMNIDQQIVNQGKQAYLRLCNEYGIDADPSKIDESVKALAEKEPAKAFEFQRKFDSLSNEVISKRGAVQQQNTAYELNKFENDYSQILTASPAISNIMRQYVQSYGANGDIYGQLEGVMDIVLPAYQEAFNAGRMYALEGKAKSDTSQVSGGIATANTSTHSSGTTFTRDQIRRMSPDEFAKYENVIKQQMLEGKIQ